MWYRVVKSSFGVGKLQTPTNIILDIATEEDEEISPLFSTLESQLNKIRTDDPKQNMGMYEKGQGAMSLFNSEGNYAHSSGKGDKMFFDNMPSDKTLI